MKELFKIDITRDTVTAFIAGAVMIGLSLLMIPFSSDTLSDEIASFLIRDVLMIFGLGIVFISIFVDNKGKNILSDMGFTREKIKRSIVLDLIFASGLLAVFLMDGLPKGALSFSDIFAAVYIITAGLFEMLFIYGFLRMSFQKAFGIIPAIILTSVFYSLHHAGFQPEFVHLFLVGLMYCSVFYITRNMLIIFPFFWGVGALWDVIISSDAGEGLKNYKSLIFALIVWVLIAVWSFYRKTRRNRNALENINSNTGNTYQG